MADMRGLSTLAAWRDGAMLYVVKRFDYGILFNDGDKRVEYERHCIHPDGYVQVWRITAREALTMRNAALEVARNE